MARDNDWRWRALEQLSSALLPRAEGVLLARWLGPAGFGTAQLLLYGLGLCEIPLRGAPFAALFHPTIAGERVDIVRRALIKWQAAWLLLLAGVATVLAGRWGAPALLLPAAAAAMAGDAFFAGPLCGRLAWRPFAWSRLGGWAARLAALGLLLAAGLKLAAVAAACAAGFLAGTWLARRSLLALPEDPPSGRRPTACEGLALAAGQAAALTAQLLLARNGLYWVERWLGERERVGLFAAALALGGVVLFAWSLSSSWIVPEFARCHRAGDEAALKRALLGALRLLCLTTLPVAAALALLAQPLLILLFGPSYAAASAVAATLSWGFFLLSLHLLFCASWRGRPWRVFALTAPAVLLQAVLCAAWVPSRGLCGAAEACLLAWAGAATLSGATTLLGRPGAPR